MTAITADDLGNDAYRAPTAELIDPARVASADRVLSTQGRLGVFSFLARALMCLLLFIAGALPLTWVLLDSIYGKPNEFIQLVTGALFFVTSLASSILFIIASVKRHHDLGLSGWLYLITFVPAIGFLWTIYYCFAPGKPETNQYGAVKPTSSIEKAAGIGSLCLLVLLVLAILYLFFGYRLTSYIL